MALYIFLPLSLLAFLVFHYLIAPRVKGSEDSNRWVGKIGKPALLALLKYVSTFLFMATLTYVLLILVVVAVGLSGATSSAGFESAIIRIQGYRAAFKAFTSYRSLAIFALIFIAVSVFLYRRLKGAIMAWVEKEKQRLRGEGQRSEWESLEPTLEMLEVAKNIYAAQVLFDRLDPSVIPQSKETEDARKELKTKIQELRNQWHDLDLERRAYRNLPARRAQTDPASRRDSTTRRFFGSKGFLETQQGTSRILAYVGLALLFLFLVGVSTTLVDAALGQRLIHLSDLQVKANQKEARESLAKLLAKEADEDGDLKKDDEDALRELSHHFERAFTSSYSWSYVYDRTSAGIRKDLVRDKIIFVYWEKPSRRSDWPKDGGQAPNPGPSNPPPPPPPPSPSEEIRSRLGSDEWPQTGIGERFSSDVRKGIIRKPRFWGRVKDSLAAYRSKFGEPIEGLEFGKWIVGEAMGATVDSAWHLMPNMGEFDEQVKGPIKAALKDAAKKSYESQSGSEDSKEVVQRIYDLNFEQYMTDLGEGMPLEQAIERVKRGVVGRPVARIDELMKLRVVSQQLLSSKVFEGLQKSLRDKPPTLREPPRDVVAAKTAAETIGKTLDSQGNTSLTNEEFSKIYAETDTYEDHYPGRSNAQETTAKGRLDAKRRNKPPDTKISEELYAQSRDFSKLKLSTDVGGVLIGRGPEKMAGDSDFRDLYWTISGDEVTLRLRRADGGEVALGPFIKEIVNDALLYVADDRKVVVTIQTSFSDNKNVWRKRVLLHPALVDTTLGNDIIEFDELVLKFTDGDPQRVAAEQRTASSRLLYTLAWRRRRLAVRQLLVEQRPDASALTVLKDLMKKDTEYINGMLNCPKNVTAMQIGLREAKKISDQEASLLFKYPAHFDPQLVSIMVDCGGRSDSSVENFGTCVQTASRSYARMYGTKEKTSQWLAAPTTTHPRSIAEEKPFSVDAGLTFLSPVEASQPAAQLWPFEFRYEIAFPARGPFLPVGEKLDVYRTPWEYLELRTLIAEKVSHGVKSDARIREMFGRVQDFTTLQRLFRISLEGGLGGQFPIENLVSLTRATTGANRRRETPRWRIKPIPQC